MPVEMGVLTALGAAVVAGAVFYVLGKRSERRIAEAAGQAAEQKAASLLADAKRSSEAVRAEMRC